MSRGLSLAVFLALVVWSVDALFLQAQMLVLDSTPVPNIAVKALLLLLISGGASLFNELRAG